MPGTPTSAKYELEQIRRAKRTPTIEYDSGPESTSDRDSDAPSRMDVRPKRSISNDILPGSLHNGDVEEESSSDEHNRTQRSPSSPTLRVPSRSKSRSRRRSPKRATSPARSYMSEHALDVIGEDDNMSVSSGVRRRASVFRRLKANVTHVDKYKSSLFNMPHASRGDLESMLDYSEEQIHLFDIAPASTDQDQHAFERDVSLETTLAPFPALRTLLIVSTLYQPRNRSFLERRVLPLFVYAFMITSVSLMIYLQAQGDLIPPISHAYTIAWTIPLVSYALMRRIVHSSHLPFLLLRGNASDREAEGVRRWSRWLGRGVHGGSAAMYLAWVVPNIVTLFSGDLGRVTNCPNVWWAWTATRIFDFLSIHVMFSCVAVYVLCCRVLIVSVNSLAVSILYERELENSNAPGDSQHSIVSSSVGLESRVIESRNHELRRLRALLRGSSKAFQSYFAFMFLVASITILFALYVLLVLIDVVDWESKTTTDLVLCCLLPVACVVLVVLLVQSGSMVTQTFQNLSKFVSYLHFGGARAEKEFLQSLIQGDQAFRVYGVVIDHQLMARLMWLGLSGMLFLLQRRQYELLTQREQKLI